MDEDKSFKEFVEHWKSRGYEVHISKEVLEDLDRLEKGWNPNKWDILSAPFFIFADLLEDLLERLPQNKPIWGFIRRLWSEMHNLAINMNRPLARRLRKSDETGKTYRIG